MSDITLDDSVNAGPQAYIEAKYRAVGIDVDAKSSAKSGDRSKEWWNAVTIHPNMMINYECSVCKADTEAFDPSLVELKLYETRGYGKQNKVIGERIQCSSSCLWYQFALAKRVRKAEEFKQLDEKRRQITRLKEQVAEADRMETLVSENKRNAKLAKSKAKLSVLKTK